MPLVEKSVRDLLTAFSSPDPTPGGGSAAALASAIGAALLSMVAALPKTRAGSDEDRRSLTAAAARLADIRAHLTGAIDADSAAYDQVVAAYKLPKTSGDEQQARTVAIQRALRAATGVPLDVMRWSAEALNQASVIAAHGHRAASSDVSVAIALLRAGLHGARLNVEINLSSVGDAAYGDAVRAEVGYLAGLASDAAAEVRNG